MFRLGRYIYVCVGCQCAVQMCVRPDPRLLLTSKALVNLILIKYHHSGGHNSSPRFVWSHHIIKVFCKKKTGPVSHIKLFKSWVRDAGRERSRVFGGLTPVQVVFI